MRLRWGNQENREGKREIGEGRQDEGLGGRDGGEAERKGKRREPAPGPSSLQQDSREGSPMWTQELGPLPGEPFPAHPQVSLPRRVVERILVGALPSTQQEAPLCPSLLVHPLPP